jgi:malate dehydrogenase
MKITVAGAGWHGSTLAFRIASAGYADEVMMVDVAEGKPQGLALDMMHSRAIDGFRTTIVGTNRYADTAGSAVCVVAAGARRSAGMSRHDLLEVNAKVVEDSARQLIEGSPDAVLIVATNPLDEMLALAQAVTGLPHRRVIGEAGVLNTARWKHIISERLAITPDRVEGIVLGSHGETMVPVPSLTTVDGRPLRELLTESDIESIAQDTRGCAAEIIAYLKTGSGYQAAAAAGETTVRAIVQDSGAVLPVCAWLRGEYGLSDLYLGVPAVLGRSGVREVVELPLDDRELAELRRAAHIVDARQNEAEEAILQASLRATGPSRPRRDR